MHPVLLENLRSATGLPTRASLALRLLDADTASDIGASDFATLASLDPACSGAILKFANARHVGRTSAVPTVRDAVHRLGIRATRVVVFSSLLVAAQHSSRRLREPHAAQSSLTPLWYRAAARGVSARALAEVSTPRRSEDAFQAGVLAEISRVALASVDPDAAHALSEADARGAASSLDAERRILGASAFAVSADLLRWWRVPRRIWSAIQALDADVEDRAADARSDVSSEVVALAGVLRGADRLASSLTGMAETFDTARAVSLINASEAEIASAVSSAQRSWDAARPSFEDDDANPGAYAEIEHRVGAALAELSLATQFENRVMKRRQDELMRRVTTDGLTGVKNRLAFDERLGEELERAQRSGRPLTLLMCDLDNFKKFNDEHGHQAGDLMLRAASEALLHGARRIDLVARYGGEEFGVIAPQCGHDGAVTIAERLRRAVKDAIIEWRGKTLGITVSIGATVTSTSGSVRTASELIEAADRLLYAAKRAGRDRALVEPAVTVTPGTAESARVGE